MDELLSTLNAEQRRAVETTEGGLLVLSGAGTGKTRVLTARIAHILARGLARPWEILALTFTNKAASEMKARIAAHGRALEWCGTFHSACLRILRRNHAAANLRPDFLIFGEDEQKAVLKNVIPALGLDIKKYAPGDFVEKISFYKDTGRGDGCEKFGDIFEAYNRELERLGGVDFGDIIGKTIGMFENSPDVLERYRNQFKYVLVDEYQDTNAAQNIFLRMIGDKNICCVGDDDQSIYSWRGAEIKNILNFAREWGAKVIRLEQNYRSTGNILNAANSLIRRNGGRLGKDLRTALGDGEKVALACAASDADEARMIADSIGAPFSNFAVLIRSGSLSRLLEEEFARRRIPCRLVGAMKFYDRMEVRDAIAYIRLLCAGFDDLSFMRVISRPRRGIGDATVGAVGEFAKSRGMPLFDAMRLFPLRPKQAAAAAEFLNAFDFNWRGMPPVDAAETLLDRAGYVKMWEESRDPDKDDRLKNVRELIRGVVSKFETLPEFLEQAALMIADDDRDADSDSVSIMTIHAAKGLEFDTVFLPAWEEDIFPNKLSAGEDNLEEERRLAYVAITRAKRRCMISCAASRMLFGSFQHNPPSRFISEIDPRFLSGGRRDHDAACAAPERLFHKAAPRGESMIGRTITHPEYGFGVIIEEGAADLTVAFKTKIKRVEKDFI